VKVGLPGLLFVLFLALKLCGVVAWPWVWVCAPLWVPLALWSLCALAIGVLAIFTAGLD
jgi:hypothetical protein